MIKLYIIYGAAGVLYISQFMCFPYSLAKLKIYWFKLHIHSYGHILKLFKSKSEHIMSTLRRCFYRDMQCQSGLSTEWVVISTISYWPSVHIPLILSDCKTYYNVPGTPFVSLCWWIRHTIESSSSLNTQLPEAFEWKHHSSHCVWVEPGPWCVMLLTSLTYAYDEPSGRSWRWLISQRIREVRWAKSYLPLNEQPQYVLTSKNRPAQRIWIPAPVNRRPPSV